MAVKLARDNQFALKCKCSLTGRVSDRRAVFTGAIGYVLVSKLHGNRRMSGVILKPPGDGRLATVKGHQSNPRFQRVTGNYGSR